ncbi:MAG: helix-turn-helix domain-containing protein, partial [Planctomycetota bacterium]
QSEDSELQKLHTRLYEAAREQRVLLLEEVLLRRAARLRPKAKQIVNAVDALVNRCASIDTVATQCSIGIRQLERRFQREVGITPQALLQIVRFQRAVRLLESDAPLSRVAYEAGYSDQAHFGRKFVAFTGTTPAAYRREAHALATAFANTD